MAVLPSPTRRAARIPCSAVELDGLLEAPAHPRGLVVFAHGSGSSRFSPRNRYVAIELRKSGFATLLLDLLTVEEDAVQGGRFDIARLATRLDAAIGWARADALTESLPLGLFGASTGAAAAIEVAAFPDARIAAVVSRGGRPDLASPHALRRLAAPTLLVVGGDDPLVLDLNERAYGKMRCEKHLAVVPGATHLFEEPGTLERVAALAAEWFGRHLALDRSPQIEVARA
jgi:putative phosphoribosyl transferase